MFIVVVAIHDRREHDLFAVVDVRNHLRAVFHAGQRRQQERRQNGDDGDDDKQLDQSETAASFWIRRRREGG